MAASVEKSEELTRLIVTWAQANNLSPADAAGATACALIDLLVFVKGISSSKAAAAARDIFADTVSGYEKVVASN